MKRRTKSAASPRSRRPESAGSRETFGQRTKRPGRVGLANEARPGLGTRAVSGGKPKAKAKGRSLKGYTEPRPAPREQHPGTMAHELELQTGMSGQSSGV